MFYIHCIHTLMTMTTRVVSTEARTDGFGAQYQNIIFDILFTSAMTPNVQYVFPSNLERMQFEHNYKNDPTFSNRLIRLMNLDAKFNVTKPIQVIRYKGTKNYAFCEANLTRLLETNAFKLIKQLFFEGKSTPYDTAFYNVAIHVRKHSAHDMRVHKRTNEPNAYYINVMRFIIENYKGTKPVRFHIHSQGNTNNEFTNFSATRANVGVEVVMHLNESVEDAFNGLVFADALATSASSFSYVAAMLTDGVVYYKQFWHKPSLKWVVGDNLRGDKPVAVPNAKNVTNVKNGMRMRSLQNMWSLCI